MTVSSSLAKKLYAGNGVTTAFPTVFQFFDASDLVVTLVSSAGVETVQVITTNYTVSGGAGLNGTVTMLVAPPTGTTLAIEREVPYDQDVDYISNDRFPAEVTESALDKLTMLAQQAVRGVRSTPSLPITFDPDNDTRPSMPLPETGKVLMGNEDEDGWENALISDLELATPVVLTGETENDTLAYNGSAFVNVGGAFNVQTYGAKGDGTTTDTAAIVEAIEAARDAGGGRVYFPQGTYITGKLTLYSNVTLSGDGPDISILKLVNSANTDLICGSGSDALWGTNTDAGIENWGLENLTLDGNRANQSAGSGIAVYGQRPRVRNVYIKNAKEYGVRTEWYQYGGDTFGMEPLFENVRVDTCGKHGWWHKGPHDSQVEGFYVIDAGQTTDATYSAFKIEGAAGGEYSGLHAWHRSATTTRTLYALDCSAAGCKFSLCNFEGSINGVNLAASRIVIDPSCFIFNAYGVAPSTPGVLVTIRNPFVRVMAHLYQDYAGRPAATGIKVGAAGGDNASAITIDATIESVEGGGVDWTHSDGGNTVRLRGFVNTGTFYTGTPVATDERDVIVTGSGGKLDRTFANGATRFSAETGVTAAGANQAAATALNANFNFHSVTIVAAGADGVRLPPALAGDFHVVQNADSADTLYIYPASGEQIGTVATDGAIVLAAGKSCAFFSQNALQWMPVVSA